MGIRENYTKLNAETWDKWAEDGIEWSIPISHEMYEAALRGEWKVFLTPSKRMPREWLGRIEGLKILGLASGGGQQMPLFTAMGAVCTVFDNSKVQLEREHEVALREGYQIRTVKGDMTQRLPFEDACFDVVFHPISNCYIEDVFHVWRECYRVLKKGGVLLANFDNGMNFLFDDDGTLPLVAKNKLPYNPLQQGEEACRQMVEKGEGIQFSHSLEENIGGQLAAGFRLTNLYEDRDREWGVVRAYTPQYIATRAVKPL